MSLRRAINAKCRDCIHDPQAGQGTWRQQVAACTCTSCPLWPVRPLPYPPKGTARPAGAKHGPYLHHAANQAESGVSATEEPQL